MQLKEIKSDLTLQSLEFLFLSQWESWYELSVGQFQFYNAKLKIKIADYEINEFVPWFVLDTSNSTITFPDKTGTVRIYQILADNIETINL